MVRLVRQKGMKVDALETHDARVTQGRAIIDKVLVEPGLYEGPESIDAEVLGQLLCRVSNWSSSSQLRYDMSSIKEILRRRTQMSKSIYFVLTISRLKQDDLKLTKYLIQFSTHSSMMSRSEDRWRLCVRRDLS